MTNPLTQPGSEGSRAGTPLGEGGGGEGPTLCRQGSRAELRPVAEEEGGGGGLESPPPDLVGGAAGGQVGHTWASTW